MTLVVTLLIFFCRFILVAFFDNALQIYPLVLANFIAVLAAVFLAMSIPKLLKKIQQFIEPKSFASYQEKDVVKGQGGSSQSSLGGVGNPVSAVKKFSPTSMAGGVVKSKFQELKSK